MTLPARLILPLLLAPCLFLCSCAAKDKPRAQYQPMFVTEHAPRPHAVEKVWLTSDRWPDSRTPQTFGKDILRIEAPSIQCEEDKAVALYHWMNRCFGQSGRAEEGPHGLEGYLLDNWATFHCYGQGHCDPTGRLFATIANGAGFPARKATTPAHAMAEVYYTDRDGIARWHLFDPILGFYIYSRDGSRIASASELGEDAMPFFDYTRVSQPYFTRDKLPRQQTTPDPETLRDRQRWFRSIQHARVGPADHDVRMNIPTGASFTRYWSMLPGFWYAHQAQKLNNNHCKNGWHDHNPPHFEDGTVKDPFNYPYWKNYLIDCDGCNSKDVRPQGHGILNWRPPLVGTDFGKEAFLCDNMVADDRPDKPRVHPAIPGRQGTLIYKVTSPYVIAATTVRATVWRTSHDWSTDLGFYFSLDDGRTWHQATNSRKKAPKVARAAARGIKSIGDLVSDTPVEIEFDLGRERWEANQPSVYGTYGFLLRIDMLGRKDETVVGLEDLEINTVVQLNMWTLPFLQTGRNTIGLSAQHIAPGRELQVTYNWDDVSGKGRQAMRGFSKPSQGKWTIDVAGSRPDDVRMNWVKLEVPGPPQPARTFTAPAGPPVTPEDRRLSCPLVASAPTLDGRLDDATWASAARLDHLLDSRRRTPADGPTRTTIRACRDAENLYLAFDCQEPNAEPLNTIYTKRDGQVHKDNNVEVSIAAAGQDSFWQIIVNSNGCIADSFIEPGQEPDRTRDLPLRAAGQRLQPRGGSWQLELAIPLKELGIDPASGPARINIARSIWGDMLGQGKLEEGQAFCPPDKSAPGVAGFGYLDFGAKAVELIYPR